MHAQRVRSAEVIIIGAGLAGAATAFFLTQRGVRDVLLLEGEVVPGAHASGRNAAMVRQVVPDPEVAALARQGAAFIRQAAEAQHQPGLYRQTGSLLLASGPDWESLQLDAEVAEQAGTAAECLTPSETAGRVPILQGAEFDGAVWCPSDGVVDVAWLLAYYLEHAQRAGAQLLTDCPVTGFGVRSGRITSVITRDGPIHGEVAVNAGGAWAGEVGRLAGAAPVALTAYRRHLFVTGPLDWVAPTWPFVWDVTHQLYFRPESSGLLLCPCDEVPWPPELPPVDPAMAEFLAEKVTKHLPGLTSIPLLRSWAGLRTFAPDRRFVVGWDPVLAGFFWVAGLGGHGVTVSGALGALASNLILAGPKNSSGPFDPARLLATREHPDK